MAQPAKSLTMPVPPKVEVTEKRKRESGSRSLSANKAKRAKSAPKQRPRVERRPKVMPPARHVSSRGCKMNISYAELNDDFDDADSVDVFEKFLRKTARTRAAKKL